MRPGGALCLYPTIGLSDHITEKDGNLPGERHEASPTAWWWLPPTALDEKGIWSSGEAAS